MDKNRLYVLVDSTLDPIYGCVQGGHAVAQWLLDNPKQTWNNNYLIYLSVPLEEVKEMLEKKFVAYTEWKEPDLNFDTTSIAVHGHNNLFENYPLIALG